jgi:hypothetical protein
MTERRLWLLVVLLGSPLVVAAHTGCDKIIGLTKRPIEENKLSCDCRCTPATQDPLVTLRVAAASDDAEQAGPTMTLGSSTLDLGQNQVGIRFANLKIPQGANILTAKVRFTANGTDPGTTDVMIFAEQSTSPATFSTTDNDLSNRTVGDPLAWSVPAWASGQSIGAQETPPELKTLLQPLVHRSDWTDSSSLVLRFDGVAGHRRASSYDDSPTRAALLEITYTTAVVATLPICASAGVIRDSSGRITVQGLQDECGRVELTLEGLATPCGYPPECTCTPITGSGDVGVCSEACDEVLVDATCSNFDPNGFERCMQENASIAACKQLVEATNAPGGSPVCVPSGSALAFHAFGSRSLCEVKGTSHIKIGDREPEQDPETTGIVEFLARPCPEGGCSVHPYFDLKMKPITFSVKWASDPTFRDLTATGRALESAVHSGGELTYAADGVEGTGNGRRRRVVSGVVIETSLAIDSQNAEPLDFGIDWGERRCDMVGSIAGAVGDDGVCSGDGTTPCGADTPDCDEVGGPCVFPDATDAMQVNVVLEGPIVNQPPTAVAGADQHVECTSTAGASFTLDDRASSDPDQNLALASWREGSRVGPLVVNGLNAEIALGLGDSRSYVLRVIDELAQTDEDTTEVSIVDTTPPDVVCNAPATMPPPNRPVSFTATATDTCTDAVSAELVAFECFKLSARGVRIDKTKTCKVVLAGDTITISPPQGVGNHIAWTARAIDGSGNVGEVDCEIAVVQRH